MKQEIIKPAEFKLSISGCLDSIRVAQLATLYAKVFAPPPWNEAVQCRNCQRFEGLATPLGASCSCGGAFTEAYPLPETMSYIEKDSQKPGFDITTIVNNEDIGGFSWRYQTTLQNLTTDKWRDPNDQARILQTLINLIGNPKQPIKYFTECGLDPNLRGQGFANDLTATMLPGAEPVVFRTNCLSPMMAVANRLGFEQIYGPKVIIDRQARAIFETGEFIRFTELQNPQRVLFIKFPQ